MENNNQQGYQNPQPQNTYYQVQQQPVVEPQKPRSAYIAAVLHLLFPLIGLGYYYRGMDEKGRNCWIMAIVGILTSWIFGAGAIVLLVAVIFNLIEAVKLFMGKITVDAKGRFLYPDF